jgi:hypothetical protein
MDGQMDGHGETRIPPYNFVVGGIKKEILPFQMPSLVPLLHPPQNLLHNPVIY